MHRREFIGSAIAAAIMGDQGSPLSAGGEFVRVASPGGIDPKVYSGVDPHFASEVRDVYNTAPNWLRRYNQYITTDHYSVHVFPNSTTMARELPNAIGIRDPKDAAGIHDQARGMQAIVVHPTRESKFNSPAAMAFAQKEMNMLTPDQRDRVVLHAMVQAYDRMGDALRPRSTGYWYLQAYNTDVTKLLNAPDTFREQLRRYGRYAADPAELYAEAGARILSPPNDDNDRLDFEYLFPNVMRAVQGDFNVSRGREQQRNAPPSPPPPIPREMQPYSGTGQLSPEESARAAEEMRKWRQQNNPNWRSWEPR